MNQQGKQRHVCATRLMWLALPFTALDYWMHWEQLPVRMAVHFDADWRANGWTSRESSFEFALLVVAFMLVVFTIASFAARRSPAPAVVPWAMTAFFYGVIIFVCAVNHWVLRYNLDSRTTSSIAQYGGSSRHTDFGPRSENGELRSGSQQEALCSRCRG